MPGIALDAAWVAETQRRHPSFKVDHPIWRPQQRHHCASTASARQPRPDQIAITRGTASPQLPAGSFLEGFRTTAPVPAALSSWAVIRNPYMSGTLSRPFHTTPLFVPNLIARHERRTPSRFLSCFGVFFCSTAPQAFFRPDRRCPTPTRAEAVKAGRRDSLKTHSDVSRPPP